jgi:hypothetical protein
MREYWPATHLSSEGTMTSSALRIKWTSVVIASISVWLLSFAVVAATIFAYAFSLGWAARGAPDFAAIQRFADTVGPLWGARLGLILTGIAALWLGYRVNAAPIWHGLLVGAVVAGIPFAMRDQFQFDVVRLAFFFSTVVAGGIGGWLGSQIKAHRLDSNDTRPAV